MARSSYFYVNTDEMVDFPRPISHKVVQIAGMGVKKLKQGELDEVGNVQIAASCSPLRYSVYFPEIQGHLRQVQAWRYLHCVRISC